MKPHHSPRLDRSAARAAAGAGMAGVDSGLAPGLVVVDSNRPPAIGAGSARGLLEQFVAAH